MRETKPFASLTSSLLARKGHAKPAMRPQGLIPLSATHEDLGWNDMGEPPAPPPPVVQQAEIALGLGVEREVALSVVPTSRAASGKGKAAFTLRLDPERHLRLRLACAVSRRSAQQMVTQALDEFLKAMPEIDDLSAKIPAAGGRK
jgi:hypothetical protein